MYRLLAFIILLVLWSNSAFGRNISFDLRHIYELTDSLEYSSWAEMLIPGSPEKGILLFKIIALTVTFPIFAVLLVWGIISELKSSHSGGIDYLDLAQRIIIFVIFIGFGTSIYGYMSSLQRGMHSLLEIVCSQESEFFLKAFYKEDAHTQNALTRAISAGKEDAIGKLLNTAKEIVKYKDGNTGAMRTATRAHYMALPLAAYNEALVLYGGDKSVSIPSGSSLKSYRNADVLIEEYPSLIKDDGSISKVRTRSLLGYAAILKEFSGYPMVYSKSEHNARESLNESILAATQADGRQNEKNTISAVASSPVPKPPSDAKLAKFLLESLSNGGQPNVAVAKFVKAQISYLCEYDPAIRQGINRILWDLYSRNPEDLDGLSIKETEEKLTKVKYASSPEEAMEHALPEGYEGILKERVSQLIIDHATIIGATRPIIKDGEVLSPAEYLEELVREPRWYQRLWEWGSSKLQSMCSLASGSLNVIGSLSHEILKFCVDILTTAMLFLQKAVVYVMVIFSSYMLTLQFFAASITSCFLAHKRAESVFYTNFRICLHLALIPFMCMLLLTVFNAALNNLWSALIPPPNGITGGTISAGGLLVPGAMGATGGYAMQLALIVAIFQIFGMLFLAVYSVKAAGILIKGGGMGGAILAMAGSALLTGRIAASAFGAQFTNKALSTMASAKGGNPPNSPGDSSQTPPTRPSGGVKTTSRNTVPMPADTSKDTHGTANTEQNSASTQRESPVSKHYNGQIVFYKKYGPKMGKFFKGAAYGIRKNIPKSD